MLTAAEIQREQARKLLFSPESTPADKVAGIRLMTEAGNAGDPEAMYLIGKMLLEKRIRLKEGDSQERAVRLLCAAASRGCLPAGTLLNAYCEERYRHSFGDAASPGGPLRDFDGSVIRINRTGWRVPVDAKLTCSNGENVLTFRLNLTFLEDEDAVPDVEKLHSAVIDGIRMWEGDYTVFGGQRLLVRIEVTNEPRLFDTVLVAVCAGSVAESMSRALSLLRTKSAVRTKQSLFGENRAMAVGGLRKWSVKSRKIIYLQTSASRFDDYEEIRHIVKHEFGHVLGLGDLYGEEERGLAGVPAGTYPELDSYLLGDSFYHLVMCRHRGLISNNDIEMVVLAFSENREQAYQPSRYLKRVSRALGRGN